MKAGDSVPALVCNKAGEKKHPVRNAICNNKPCNRETRHIISLIVYIRKQDKPLITGASFHYEVRLALHRTRHDAACSTARQLLVATEGSLKTFHVATHLNRWMGTS